MDSELELQANFPLAEDIILQGSFSGGILKDLSGDKTFNISDHLCLGGPLNKRGFDSRGLVQALKCMLLSHSDLEGWGPFQVTCLWHCGQYGQLLSVWGNGEGT